MANQIPPWGRAHRRIERATARELAKEIMRSDGNKHHGIPQLHVALWFLEAFLALGLLLLAPKLGRTGTFFVLLAMATSLVYPLIQTPWVRKQVGFWKWGTFSGLMMIAIIVIAGFGIYVWPPLPYYHTLSAQERTKFIGILKSQATPRQVVRVGCPNNNEDVCIVAKEYAELFQWGGWKVEGPAVQRLMLARPMAGVALMERSTGIGTPDIPGTGVWVKQTDSEITMQGAFRSIDIDVEKQGDYTMPEGTIGVYFGPAPR